MGGGQGKGTAWWAEVTETIKWRERQQGFRVTSDSITLLKTSLALIGLMKSTFATKTVQPWPSLYLRTHESLTVYPARGHCLVAFPRKRRGEGGRGKRKRGRLGREGREGKGGARRRGRDRFSFNPL